MNKYLQHKQIFNLLAVVFFATSCNRQVKTNSPTSSVSELKVISVEQPKLVKTQGSTEEDNVWCSLQDKAGNLWFGTTGEGVYRYDGNSFTQFTEKNGLTSNAVYSILEDTSGNIWTGTRNTGLYKYDGENFYKLFGSVNLGRK